MTEQQVQEAVCNYLRLKHPRILFRSDLGGIRLTLGQAAKVRRVQQSRAWPDLMVCAPRGNFHGLFIELKKEGVAVHKQDGSMRSNPHFQEQEIVLQRLRDEGYKAEFAIGFLAACELIEEYLGNQSNVSN